MAEEEPRLKIMPVAPCNAVANLSGNVTNYGNASYSSWYKPSKQKQAEAALAALEAALAADTKQHEANVPAIENNRRIAALIESTMTGLGIPKQYQEVDPKSRARYTKYHTVPAGWVRDTGKFVHVTDGWPVDYRYNQLKRDFTEKLTAAQREEEQAKAKAEADAAAAKKKRESDLKLLAICQRYGLEPGTDYDDALDALRKTNQRLDLALAMLATRGDWSEGCYRVEDALCRFKVETDEDAKIQASAESGCEEFEDGRVFRDCVWGYDRIFSTLDKQLYDDAMLLYNNGKDF